MAVVSESRLDPSDAQISRHAMGQLAEQAKIMRLCLIEQGFVGTQLDSLLLTWWEVTLRQVLQPDLQALFSQLTDPGQDDDH